MKPTLRDLNKEIQRHVEVLCSEECAGREAGSLEGRHARRYIIDELRTAGLEAATQKVPGSRGVNVIARINPGAGKIVLIGAHYDHIGRAWEGEAYWGADDNAAAVAIVLELARVLADARGGEVALVLFDGEEPPHFLTEEMGSIQFCKEPPIDLEQIELAIIMDLVGHAVGPDDAPSSVRNTVFALGAEKSLGTAAMVDEANLACEGVAVHRLDLDVVPPLSDYEPLRAAGVPVLFITCGRWRHYHQVTDTPEKLDYPKITALVGFIADLTRRRLTSSEAAGRYQKERRDHAGTVSSLLTLARELVPSQPDAALAVAQLEPLAARLHAGETPTLSEWSTVLQILALMEQGLA